MVTLAPSLRVRNPRVRRPVPPDVMTWMSRSLPLVVCAALLVGCGGSPDPAPEESAVDQSTPSATPTPSPDAPSSSPGTGTPAVEQSIDDLAASLGVDRSTVEIVSVEDVTWRDGSRGCAKPGDSYTQALIDGSRITLGVGGRTYEYHSGGSRPPALCDEPTE